MSILLPNQTLYIKNLPEKVKKPLLLASLNALFTPTSKVLSIKIIRSKALRGQAWVTFDTIAGATSVLAKFNGVQVGGKGMDVSYAKEKTDSVAKSDGTYESKEVKVKREAKRQEKAAKVVAEDERKRKLVEDAKEIAAKRAKTGEGDGEDANDDDSGVDGVTPPPPPPAQNNPFSINNEAPPSAILLCPSLPLLIDPPMLSILFSQYQGFLSASCPKQGIGIIKFKSSEEAGVAKEALSGFKLTPEVGLEIGFGKD